VHIMALLPRNLFVKVTSPRNHGDELHKAQKREPEMEWRGRKKEKKRHRQSKRANTNATHASKRRVIPVPGDAGIGGARWCNIFKFHNLLNQTNNNNKTKFRIVPTVLV